MLSFQDLKEGVSMHEKTGDKFEPTAIFMTNFEIQKCQRAKSLFNARFRLVSSDFRFNVRSLFNEENSLKVKFFFKHNSFYTEPQRLGALRGSGFLALPLIRSRMFKFTKKFHTKHFARSLAKPLL